ncbi:hypothetical protein [uncultured Sulfitobacter sp.]|tara:strand:- start:111687 stop:111830 length:144 start_codon:yes stop_codon:yes gene_type:complete
MLGEERKSGATMSDKVRAKSGICKGWHFIGADTAPRPKTVPQISAII